MIGLLHNRNTEEAKSPTPETLTINTGVGALVPIRPTAKLNLAIRYLHISNAGLPTENAGYDAFHLVIGVHW